MSLALREPDCKIILSRRSFSRGCPFFSIFTNANRATNEASSSRNYKYVTWKNCSFFLFSRTWKPCTPRKLNVCQITLDSGTRVCRIRRVTCLASAVSAFLLTFSPIIDLVLPKKVISRNLRRLTASRSFHYTVALEFKLASMQVERSDT